jgi:voltage-gated potassium channel
VDRRDPAYLIFILSLSIVAIALVAVEAIFTLDSPTQIIIDYADIAICGLFFVDFLFTLSTEKHKWRYFYRWGWIDLLSSVPMIDFLRWGRVTRVMRIFRVLRGIKAARLITSVILERRAQSICLAACLVSIILIGVSAISMLHFEKTIEGANIKTAEDAMWWAVVTITTVGYGDKYPVTSEGRALAVILMAAGVGLFGTFSGFIASWFLTPGAEKRESEIEALHKELSIIKELLIKRGGL